MPTSPCCSFPGRCSRCIRSAPLQGAAAPVELQQPKPFLGLRNMKRRLETQMSAPSPGLGEPLTHRHRGWRAALEDGAVSALPGPGETRSHSSGMERKDLCAAHTNVASGAAAALPAPGRCERRRRGRHLFGRSSPGLTFPSDAALAAPRSPACCPAAAPQPPGLPAPAPKRSNRGKARGPRPALLAARSWWWGSAQRQSRAGLRGAPGSGRIRLLQLALLGGLKLPVSPPFQSPYHGTLSPGPSGAQ